MRSFIKDHICWLRHMRLDADTGKDPGGIKLRAANGLEAVDYFMPGYHVWAKLVEALADMGYDANNLVSVGASTVSAWLNALWMVVEPLLACANDAI